MNAIKLNSIVEGLAAGVAASLLLGLFVIARNLLRDAYLRWQLTRQFRNLCLGTSIRGITLNLRNHLGRPFTIRRAVLVTDKANYRFSPTGEVSTSFDEDHPKITWQQSQLLKTGKVNAIQVGAEFQFRSWQAAPTPAGFVEAESFTSHEFVLPAQLFADFDSTILGIRVTIQYQTWTKTAKLLTVESQGSVEHLRSTVAQFREQIRSGSLDKARAMFRMPPVGPAAGAEPSGNVSKSPPSEEINENEVVQPAT